MEEQTRTNIWLIWLGVLLPAALWAIQMEVNYALVPFRCYGGGRLPIYIVGGSALAVVLLNAGNMYRHWQRLGLEIPDENANAVSVGRFLAVVGLLSSGMFALVITTQLIATIVFHPCTL